MVNMRIPLQRSESIVRIGNRHFSSQTLWNRHHQALISSTVTPSKDIKQKPHIDQIKNYLINKYTNSQLLFKKTNSLVVDDRCFDSGFNSLVSLVRVSEIHSQLKQVLPPSIQVHLFNMHDDAETNLGPQDSPTSTLTTLPNRSIDGLWDSLVFTTDIKSFLLDYVSTALLFSDMQVDPDIVAWNRVILLHGPPGTGKTSLCKALAQKLSIRFSSSKYFSESGKLVMQQFKAINELCQDQGNLVCVLIGSLPLFLDEVESLTSARKAAMSGSEPSDSIRVVNAVITQLDKLRNFSNVLILTTSNITGALDLAFVDRADVKWYIGNPEFVTRYHIMKSCIEELMRAGIIWAYESIFDFKSVEKFPLNFNSPSNSHKLYEIMKKCDGYSGRRLRKLPFIAHAQCIKSGTCSLSGFLDSLNSVVDKQVGFASTED